MNAKQLEARTKVAQEICNRLAEDVMHEHGIRITNFHISYLLRGFAIGHRNGHKDTFLDLDALLRSSLVDILRVVKGVFLAYRSADAAFAKGFDPSCGWVVLGTGKRQKRR